MGKILITRSGERGEALYRQLISSKRSAIWQPMQTIVALPEAELMLQISALANTRVMLVVTSMYVVRALTSKGVKQLQAIACANEVVGIYAIGESTRDTLREIGIEAIVPPITSSECLLEMLEVRRAEYDVLWLLKGENGRTLIEETQKQWQKIFVPIENYRRESCDVAELPSDIACVVAISAEAIALFVEAWRRCHALLPMPTMLVCSARMAKEANNLGVEKVHIAATCANADLYLALEMICDD